MLQPGAIVNGKYEILKLVGKGGMSAVYKARNRENGQILAIKDALKTSNSVTEQSLAAEGRVLKGLSNPHLPRIYDIIENQDSIMLVMDFVEGNSLDKILAAYGPKPVESAYLWGMQVCQVFDYLHNQASPIIYRDMKPANLILQANGNIMVIDFGTARTQKFNTNMSSDTINIGTAGFAAPEQYGGMGQSDARTDIFCLGATLYNIVTGHSPSEPPRGVLPLETFKPELANSPIQEIIRKATRNDPNERYQTAREMMSDLYLAQTGQFKVSGKSGKASSPSGGWQNQKVKSERNGLTSGLSGLLTRRSGKTGLIGQSASAPQTPPAPPAPHSPVQGQWKTPGAPQPLAPQPLQQSAKPVQVPIPAAANRGYTPSQYGTVPAQGDYNAYYGAAAATAAEADTEMNKKLALIAAIIAAGMLVITVILAAFGEMVGAVITVLLSLVAVGAVLAEVLIIKNKEQQSQ